MIKFGLKILINSAAIYLASSLIEGFTFSGNLFILIGIGLALALFHSFIYPIIKILAFPLVLVSFGLFSTAINVALLWGLAQYLPQLSIDGITPLLLGTIMISLANLWR